MVNKAEATALFKFDIVDNFKTSWTINFKCTASLFSLFSKFGIENIERLQTPL